MRNEIEEKCQSAGSWRRAPLALAVALALGSASVLAQTHTQPILSASTTQQAVSQVSGKELVIIDGNVEDMATLLKAVPHGAEWVVLDSGRDGVKQLAEIAERYKNIRALHLLSHGEDGLLKLGNSELNPQNIADYRNELATLAASMAPGADLLLYGCEVAKTAKGEQFIRALKASTGLDVAASNDTTQNGDWELEIATGTIDAATISPEGYSASLDIIAGDGSGGGGSGGTNIIYSGGDGGGDNDTLTGTANADVLFGDGSGGGAGMAGMESDYTVGAGGGGADTLNGGAGNDILFGDGFDGGVGGQGYAGRGGFGGGGGGGGSHGKSGAAGGLFAGNGGDSTATVGYAGGNGTGSLGGAGVTSYYGYGFGGGGGGWSDGSGAGDGATAVVGDLYGYGVAGVAGSVTPLTFVDDGGAGSYRETIKGWVDAGAFISLYNGAGADTLDGGPGSDDLFGMGGADIFQFEVTDAPAANNDTDTIRDFVAGTDTIQLLDGGVLIDSITRDALLLDNQTATPTASDRTLVYTVDTDTVTIVVLGIGNDLTASDVPATFVNTAPTVNPSIDEAVAVGSSFTVSENGFDYDDHTLTYSYQWSAGGTDIGSATNETFTPTAAEAHASITVTVTADDGNDGTATATTAGVTVINSSPTFSATPTIDGTALVGSTLSVINTATDADNDATTLTNYQWQADGEDIPGATDATFTPTTAQGHALITATVTANDGYGGTSAPATTAGVRVSNSSPTFDATPTISGTAEVGSRLSVANTATTDVDGDTVTLSYQWQADGEDIVGETDLSLSLITSDAEALITVAVIADDGNGGTATVTSAGVTVTAVTTTATSSSGGGGALTILNWMLGLLLGGRLLLKRGRRRD